MKETISPENEQFLDQSVKNGVFRNRDEAINAAVEMLRARAELQAHVDLGVEQLRNGQCTEYDDESLKQRAEEIKRAGRKKLVAKNSGNAE